MPHSTQPTSTQVAVGLQVLMADDSPRQRRRRSVSTVFPRRVSVDSATQLKCLTVTIKGLPYLAFIHSKYLLSIYLLSIYYRTDCVKALKIQQYMRHNVFKSLQCSTLRTNKCYQSTENSSLAFKASCIYQAQFIH